VLTAMVSGFADLLARQHSERSCCTRLITPEDPAHSWCAVARPLLLSARLSCAGHSSATGKDASSGDNSVLLGLLPLIFEKLLGRSLDAVPWGTAALRVLTRGATTRTEEGNVDKVTEAEGDITDDVLHVAVALAAPPTAVTGLFEVDTPLGTRVALRLLGVEDTMDRVEPEAASLDDPVVLLTLPSDWFLLGLIRRAWDEKAVDLIELSPDADEYDDDDDEQADEGNGRDQDAASRRRRCGGVAWREWFAQWGTVTKLEISAHAGNLAHAGENGGDSSRVLVAATFADGMAACSRCAAALGDGNLLVLQDPARTAFPRAVCASRLEFDEKADAAWREHLRFEQEIDRMDRALVLAEVADAVPAGAEEFFGPLAALMERWIRFGTVHATSTICGQRRLQEAESGSGGRSRSPELFRRACWHAAFRVVLQVRQSQDSAETMAPVLCEHWRKAHGIFIDPDAAELEKLSDALKEVWALSTRAEDATREQAEAQARAAEESLLEELDEDANRAASEAARKERKKRKERERKKVAVSQKKDSEGKDGSAAAGIDRQDDARKALDDADEIEAAVNKGRGASADATPAVVNKENSASVKSGQPSGRTSKRSSQQQPPRGSSPPAARRSTDIDSILEAVRKSQELHQNLQMAQRADGALRDEKVGPVASEAGSTCEGASVAEVAASEAPSQESQAACGSTYGDELVVRGRTVMGGMRRWSSFTSTGTNEAACDAGVDNIVATSTSGGNGSETCPSSSAPSVGVSTPRLVVQPPSAAEAVEGLRAGNPKATKATPSVAPAPAAASREVVTWSDLGCGAARHAPLATSPPAVGVVPVHSSPMVPVHSSPMAHQHDAAVPANIFYRQDAASRTPSAAYGIPPHLSYMPYGGDAMYAGYDMYTADAGYGAAMGFDGDEDLDEEGDDCGELSEFRTSKSSRRSARRRQRKRRGEKQGDDRELTDTNTAVFGSLPNAAPPDHMAAVTPVISAASHAAVIAVPNDQIEAKRASSHLNAMRPMPLSADSSRPREVVTCCDLGLDFFGSPAPAANKQSTAPWQSPQVPPLPGHYAALQKPVAADTCRELFPSAVAAAPHAPACRAAASPWLQPCPDAWVHQSPCSPPSEAMSHGLMTTYPVQQSPAGTGRAAGDASQRMSPMAASPGAAPFSSPMPVSSTAPKQPGESNAAFGLWLQASGLTSPCHVSDPLSRADIAAQLLAVAPEAYED